jgi:y4mF family transcriptional regulator
MEVPVLRAADIGQVVRSTRKQLGLTQNDLALAAGTGHRFIRDLEHGKPTCRLETTLRVLDSLGIDVTLAPTPS